MAKTKEQKPITDLYSETISSYSLEDRVTLHNLLTTGIKNEADELKKAGDKASELLGQIENNGK